MFTAFGTPVLSTPMPPTSSCVIDLDIWFDQVAVTRSNVIVVSAGGSTVLSKVLDPQLCPPKSRHVSAGSGCSCSGGQMHVQRL